MSKQGKLRTEIRNIIKEVVNKPIKIIKGSVWYKGYSSPDRVIVVSVVKGRVGYRMYPYDKTYYFGMDTAISIFTEGTLAWLRSGYAQYFPEVATKLKVALSGGKPYVRPISDFDRIEVTIVADNDIVDLYGMAKRYGVINHWNGERLAKGELQRGELPRLKADIKDEGHMKITNIKTLTKVS